MKKFLLIIFCSLSLFFSIVLFLSLGITQPLSNTAEEFFQLIKTSKYTSAYQLTSREFQKQIEPQFFQEVMEQFDLNTYQEVLWIHRSIRKKLGTAQGIVKTDKSEFPVEIQFVYEDKHWKIKEIESKDVVLLPSIQPQATPVPLDKEAIPSRTQLRQLVTTSLLAFNRAVKEQNFDKFYHDELSPPFQQHITPLNLKKVFQEFIDSKIDFKAIEQAIAIFDKHPLIVEEILTLSGYYHLPQYSLRFKLKYFKKNTWKLTAIALETTEDLKAVIQEIKLPTRDEQESMVKATLLAIEEALEQGSFQRFHQTVLSTPFQKKFSAEQLEKVFQVFRKQNIHLIEDQTPTFEKKPKIDSQGHLTYKGHFKTQPTHIYFDLSYLYEEGEWKLTDLHLSFQKSVT